MRKVEEMISNQATEMMELVSGVHSQIMKETETYKQDLTTAKEQVKNGSLITFDLGLSPTHIFYKEQWHL